MCASLAHKARDLINSARTALDPEQVLPPYLLNWCFPPRAQNDTEQKRVSIPQAPTANAECKSKGNNLSSESLLVSLGRNQIPQHLLEQWSAACACFVKHPPSSGSVGVLPPQARYFYKVYWSTLRPQLSNKELEQLTKQTIAHIRAKICQAAFSMWKSWRAAKNLNITRRREQEKKQQAERHRVEEEQRQQEERKAMAAKTLAKIKASNLRALKLARKSRRPRF